MQTKDHWENVYTTKPADAVSWYQPHADVSFDLINCIRLGCHASIIDVGGGASVLVDDLLDHGFFDVTVLDLSASALAAARHRLGPRAADVEWMEADITRADLPANCYDIWHDRAVFHFLTTEEERAAYVRQVFHSVKPGGHVIVATFAEDGPEQCSGLPVMRYRPDELHAEFGEGFKLLNHRKEAHHTPAGKVQQFVYCYCRRITS